MTVAARRPAGVAATTMAALMLAVFTVSLGYGVVLPLLPYVIERLVGAGVQAAQVSRNTGLLTGVYAVALFLFAPAWGRASDRHGRRGVLLVGLVGFGVTMLAFSFFESFTAVYAERFLSGMFASAVTPVASATIGDLAPTAERRARRLALVSMAGIGGFMLGPTLGVFITRHVPGLFTIARPAGSLAVPLAATAVLAFLVGVAVALAVPKGESGDRQRMSASASSDGTSRIVTKLLVLAFVVSAGVGGFEVGIALRGKQELGLPPYQIALMFTECSVVMFAMQAIVFSPWVKPHATRWLIPPALAVLSAGLFLVPRASGFALMLAVVGGVAASAGILSPIVTYWISSRAGDAQGARLGKQTAAASLGAAVGSAAGGLLFDVAALSHVALNLMGGLALFGFLLSLRLPNLLVSGLEGGTLNSREVLRDVGARSRTDT